MNAREKQEMLFWALRMKLPQVCLACISNGADVTACVPDGRNALTAAIYQGFNIFLKMALNFDDRAWNAVDGRGENTVIAAVRCKRFDLLLHAVHRGASIYTERFCATELSIRRNDSLFVEGLFFLGAPAEEEFKLFRHFPSKRMLDVGRAVGSIDLPWEDTRRDGVGSNGLMSICRRHIREHLLLKRNETNLFCQISRLELPVSLKSFLLKDVFDPEWFYIDSNDQDILRSK